MFNIYYINYAKAYEIAMLIDNKISESLVKEEEQVGNKNLESDTDTSALENLPVLKNYVPKLSIKGSYEGTITNKIIDTVKVISTHSTILNPIYQKSREVTKLEEKNIGDLIKIKNVSLEIANEDEVFTAKTLLSGIIEKVPVNGVGNFDVATLLEVMYKDYSYILNGKLPQKRFRNNKNDEIIIKIPMKAEGEMENQYNISDLEIGVVTIVGIYRGKYFKNELVRKLNKFDGNDQTQQSNNDDEITIESEDDDLEEEINRKVHYIDVIAIVQDINL